MMNSCRDIERDLAAFGSGELSPTAQAQVQAHLDACPACRAELARELSLRHTLGSLPPVPAPCDLDARILAAVRQNPRRSARRRWPVRLSAAAGLAAACLALAILGPFWGPSTTPQPAWTQAEMSSARREVAYTLALAADVINRTQQETMVDVFADRLPNAINESFRKIRLTNPGGEG